MGLKKVRGGWVKKPQTRLFYMAQKGILWFERWLIFLYFYISASALSSSSDIWECIVTVGWSTQFCLQEVLPRSSCCHPWMVFPPPSLALTATVCPGVFTFTSTVPPSLTARRLSSPWSLSLITPELTAGSRSLAGGWGAGDLDSAQACSPKPPRNHAKNVPFCCIWDPSSSPSPTPCLSTLLTMLSILKSDFSKSLWNFFLPSGYRDVLSPQWAITLCLQPFPTDCWVLSPRQVPISVILVL